MVPLAMDGLPSGHSDNSGKPNWPSHCTTLCLNYGVPTVSQLESREKVARLVVRT